MKTPIITVKNISKKYNIVHQQGDYIAMRDVLTNIAKKPFSFLKHKAKKLAGKTTKEEFWALRNIDFDVQKGETIGIIGSNGAGKSTLLKILTGITPPTTGEIRMHGKVASLLEVGTGFHPELTGRENIFLNGAILGMSKKEIAEKFDAIVEFSGIRKFIDTPVKRYSSGMTVRLGFSVAAHMDPDILLVDEVLAVGDAEFQKKCIGKMNEVTKTEGRTILFVSHNMSAVQKLCKKTILLKEGKIEMIGKTEDVINKYLNTKSEEISNQSEINYTNTKAGENKVFAKISKISILDKNNKPNNRIPLGENFYIDIEYIIDKKIDKSLIQFIFFNENNDLILLSNETDKNPSLKEYHTGKYKLSVKIPAFLFNTGSYFFNVSIQRPFMEKFDQKENIGFEITASGEYQRLYNKWEKLGNMATILEYSTKNIS